MLVLIAGATGSLGFRLIDSIISRGHQVRVVARHPEKISPERFKKLESFVKATSYYDVPALEKACAGVDAVICAYNGAPYLQLDGQLILLRAAERAGVQRYLASTFCADYRGMQLGEQDSYDGFLSFDAQARKSSNINPNYIFTGVLGEVLFAAKDTMDYSTKNNGPWDPENKRFEVWGTGDEKWHWTSEADAAEFAAQIILRDDAANGGYWCVNSGHDSLKQMAKIYEQVRGVPVKLDFQGSIKELHALALEGRKNGSPKAMWDYIGWFYYYHIVSGRWYMKTLDNEKLGVRATPLEEFLRANSDI
ncbi:unnamed protein product [Clonostachys rosea]|uniref:NmrA-like domain-containing protein n=1 Tax=Bionectria ochroleuca TaxID=29856 RepID=A0ABY6UP01_BIOOC|nr:unnamed protein product [Clonostachys rosea]